jgi:hypothetical protein
VNVAHHAIALGYFFLAAFCALASAHSFLELRRILLAAAALALIAGIGYVASPLAARLRAFCGCLSTLPEGLVKLIRIAQEPPDRAPSTKDERSV